MEIEARAEYFSPRASSRARACSEGLEVSDGIQILRGGVFESRFQFFGGSWKFEELHGIKVLRVGKEGSMGKGRWVE